jgi:hypothetical protein
MSCAHSNMSRNATVRRRTDPYPATKPFTIQGAARVQQHVMEHNKNAKPEQWDSSWGLNRPSAALFTMRVGGWSVSVREPFQHHVLVVGTSAPTKFG